MYYRHHVFFCTNKRENGKACCQDADALAMRGYAKERVKSLGLAGKGRVRVSTSGCLDRCKEGPVVVIYPDAVWYSYKNQEDIDEIISEHLINGRVVDRLLI